MQKAKCQVKLAVPAEPPLVVVPVLVKFSEQREVALSPAAQLLNWTWLK